jgi:predicted nucleic-acid-binding protein
VIGLDTNVLVRYITQDDPKQSPKANRLIESLSAENPGFVSLVTLVELSWVLSACYGLQREALGETLATLLRSAEIVLEEAETAWKALRLYRGGRGDFADCLIVCAGDKAGCEFTATFDRQAARDCGLRLIA